ncbi:hypothetical protein CEXT_54541 [Caerostris extrusa]|uniref:Uncharacterized protein n=1 Tax=Caerostris extrusa TaxID=172846 RepID=A0AAV4WQP3_CAEEX|nr:hypothetical protein CEXT_54541 [Caerostris extrusa]
MEPDKCSFLRIDSACSVEVTTLFESLAKSPSDGEMLSPFKIPEVCLAAAERNQWQPGENEDSIGIVCKDRSVGFQTISLTVTRE